MIMIIITIMIMNFEIQMQNKVSSAVAYDFNQLIHAIPALPSAHAPPRGKNLPRPPLMLTITEWVESEHV